MTRARTFRLLCCLLLALVAAVAGGLSASRRIQTFQPLGFTPDLSAPGVRVADVADPGTGLAPGDHILMAGSGETDPAEIVRQLRRQPESRLTVSRGDELATVAYQRPPLDVDIPYLLLALIGVGYLLIGLYTLSRQAGSPSFLFFLWCLVSALFYLLTPVPPADALFKLSYVGDELARLLLPALTLHFFLVFPAPLLARARARRLHAFLYLPAALLAFLQLDQMRRQPPSTLALALLDRLEMLHLAVFALAGIAVLAWRLMRGREAVSGISGSSGMGTGGSIAIGTWEQGRQLRWLALGMAGGYVPFLLLYGLPWVLGLGSHEIATTLAVLPLALVPLAFAWAILRYKLWDIEVIVRDTIASTATLMLGIIGFSLVNLAIVRGVPQELAGARNFLSFGAGLAIAGLLVPTRRGISSTLERLQYRGTFGKRQALTALGRELLTERDLTRLCSAVLQHLEEAVEVDPVNLYLLQGVQGGPGDLAPVRPEPGLPSRMPALALGEELWSEPYRRLSAISGVSGVAGFSGISGAVSGKSGRAGTAAAPVLAALLPGPGEPDSPARRLFAAGYRYAFPLAVLGNRVGIVLTGSKPGGDPLNSEDTELVRHLLDQAALAIENAQLLGQLHRQLDEVGRLQRYNQGILESSPAGIAVLDREDRVVSANAAFVALTGFGLQAGLQAGQQAGLQAGREAVVGRPLAAVLPVEPLPAPGDAPLEASYCDSAGRERYLQLSVSDYDGAYDGGEALDRTGRERMRVLVVHDVSERVAMENALKEKDRLAALGMLAAGVAHEVNTPITGISSYAQMLLAETAESDPHYEILKKVERQTFRAARIVNNLLEFARNRPDERRPLALPPLVHEALDLFADRLKRRGIRVDWSAPAEPAVVFGSDGELQQVFTNLFSNAIDAISAIPGVPAAATPATPEPPATTAGGRLGVRFEAADGHVRVAIEDSGPGIPPDQLDRIFQPFFSTKLSRGGTGLGLAISHEIVQRHGGRLTVANREEGGARFVVELPRTTA